MSGKSIISNSYLEDIGDAIRYKKGTSETFYPSQMGDAIRSIEGIVPVGSIDIDANGTYNVTDKAEAVVSVEPDLRPLSVSENGNYQPDDFDGYSDVTVDVEPALESLSVTENGLYLPTAGVDGYDRVTVDVPQPSGSTTITQNGTYDVEDYVEAVVNVPPTIPDLVPLDVTENGQYLPTGHDGFSEVNVNVPTGGGGGLTLLDTIEVNGVRGVQVDIDASWFDDYDYVLLVPELTFSTSDWLYVIVDATSGGNTYADRGTSAVPSQAVFISRVVGTISVTWLNGRQAAGYMSPSYLYWYLYYASTTMTGTIKIYGIKVS